MPPIEAPPRRSTRRAWVRGAVVAMGGALLYAAFYALVTPDLDRSTDPSRPIGFIFAPDDDERIPRPHLVTASVWSHRDSPVRVSVWYRAADETAFREIAMQRIGVGTTYAAELPALEKGERYFYYLVARDGQGAVQNIPAHAPEAPLPHVRWEGKVDLRVLALHVTLMIGAVFFLIHAVHYGVLVFLAGGNGATRSALGSKVHRGLRWGWICFFTGGVPLGIYVSGTALGWSNAWGAWPWGYDITDTKTAVLIAYWGLLLLARADLWPSSAKAWVSDRAFAVLVFTGALLTLVAYAIPHSFFFQ